jgi:hypothetical protein
VTALQRLAQELRSEGGILAATVVDADAPQPHGDAVAVKGEDYPLLVEAIREGYLQHYEGGRVVQRTTRTSRCWPVTGSTRSASSGWRPSATWRPWPSSRT